MTQKQIEYFLETADTLSISKTATQNYVSQPAVSKQIAALEQEWGLKLFTRTRNGHLILTHAGERMVSVLRECKSLFESEYTALKNIQYSNKVTVGCMPSVNLCNTLLDCILRRHHIARYDFSINSNLHSEDSDNGFDLLVDFDTAFPPEQYDFIPLMNIRDYFAFSKHDPLNTKSELSIQDFSQKQLFMPSTSLNTRHSHIRHLLTKLGISPPVAYVPDATSLIISVIRDNGFCIVDDLCRERNLPSFSFFPCSNTRTLVIAFLKENSNRVYDSAINLMEIFENGTTAIVDSHKH